MRQAERLFIYTAAVVALAAGLGSLAIDRPAIASANLAANKFATVNVLDLMQESLQVAPFLPEREEVANRFTQQIQSAEAEVQRLQQELQLQAPGSPQALPLQQQLQGAAQRLQALGQQANAEFQALAAEQAERAYARIHEVTDAIASENGYDMVIASARDADINSADNLNSVTQEILARPVIYGVNADDLTVMVRERLGLPDPSEADTGADAGEATDAMNDE